MRSRTSFKRPASSSERTGKGPSYRRKTSCRSRPRRLTAWCVRKRGAFPSKMLGKRSRVRVRETFAAFKPASASIRSRSVSTHSRRYAKSRMGRHATAPIHASGSTRRGRPSERMSIRAGDIHALPSRSSVSVMSLWFHYVYQSANEYQSSNTYKSETPPLILPYENGTRQEGILTSIGSLVVIG